MGHVFNYNLPLDKSNGVDTSSDTVTPDDLLEGVTAHDADGNEITGTHVCEGGGTDTSGDTVTPETLLEGVTAHDASGEQITGTLDTDAIRAEGYTEGEAAGIEVGKQAEYDTFWNSNKIEKGKIGIATFAGKYWNNTTFKPPFDLVANQDITCAFYYSDISGSFINAKEEFGIDISFPDVMSGSNAFAHSKITELPAITITGFAANLFAYARYLTQIEKLVFQEGVSGYTNMLNQCTALENLTIEGAIIANGFNASWSPLAKASLTSIVNALSDATTGLTVTLRLSAIKTAFETSEGAADGDNSEEWLTLVATKPNCTINAIDS